MRLLIFLFFLVIFISISSHNEDYRINIPHRRTTQLNRNFHPTVIDEKIILLRKIMLNKIFLGLAIPFWFTQIINNGQCIATSTCNFSSSVMITFASVSMIQLWKYRISLKEQLSNLSQINTV